MSVVSAKVELTKGKLMELHEMTQLIRTVWSDSMSDNGAIWAKSNAQLQQARTDYPELYLSALEWLYSKENV
jgi:hypothetical protein